MNRVNLLKRFSLPELINELTLLTSTLDQVTDPSDHATERSQEIFVSQCPAWNVLI